MNGHVSMAVSISREEFSNLERIEKKIEKNAGIHILQEIFAIDMLTVLKPFLEHDWKHVLRLSQLFFG